MDHRPRHFPPDIPLLPAGTITMTVEVECPNCGACMIVPATFDYYGINTEWACGECGGEIMPTADLPKRWAAGEADDDKGPHNDN